MSYRKRMHRSSDRDVKHVAIESLLLVNRKLADMGSHVCGLSEVGFINVVQIVHLILQLLLDLHRLGVPCRNVHTRFTISQLRSFCYL